MGWERRGNKGRMVYYRKVRVGGKVKSVYCGSGERGRAAEREDQERREAAKRHASPAEVLQGATPEASEGATPQSVENAPNTGIKHEYYRSRFLPQKRPIYRRYKP